MSKVLLGDWVFLRAARDIEPGEELSQFYCDVRMPLEMRQKELLELFGFCCQCPRCRFELLLEPEEPYRQLYSCAVPPTRFASELESIVAQAEQCARKALGQRFQELSDPKRCCKMLSALALEALTKKMMTDDPWRFKTFEDVF